MRTPTMLRFRRQDDEGFTMLVVMASAFLVMAMVLVGIGYAVVSVNRSRDSQDYRGALAAAQAGVQDYLSRLNNCETYYLANNTCGGTVNAALESTTGGAVVPGTNGATAGRYVQHVVSTPLTTGSTGGVRLEVTGTVNGQSRTLTVDLIRNGFLKYLYYTDFETFSPLNTALRFSQTSYTTGSRYSESYTFTGGAANQIVTWGRSTTVTLKAPTVDQVTRGCQRYHYATATTPARDTFPRTVTVNGVDTEIWPASGDSNPFGASQFQCLTINFSGNDVFNGPVHTNDSMSLSGPVTFQQSVTTGWSTSGNPWYGSSNPSPGSKLPTYQAPFSMPSTATQQLQVATANGCVYTGPTSIKFLSDGTMQVLSPNTAANTVNAGCTTGSGASKITTTQTVTGPTNGVIYVQPTTTAGNCIAAYQQYPNDQTNYNNSNCQAGDAFVSGDLSGQRTVAAEHGVVVVGNTKYVGGSSGTDVLGLIGQNNVAVWHPVNSFGNSLLPNTDLRIDAAIASVNNSFTVFNYNVGNRIGTLTINGVIIQKFRGPVATGSGSSTSSGYAKNYQYDSRLTSLPPPTFIAPVNDPWSVAAQSEQ